MTDDADGPDESDDLHWVFNEHVAVTGVGLATALGSDAEELLQALRQRQRGKVSKSRLKNGVDGYISHEVIRTPVKGRHAGVRAGALLTQALAFALQHIPEDVDPQRVLIYTLIAPEKEARAKQIDTHAFWDAIDLTHERVIYMPRCFGTSEYGTTEHFLIACDFLYQDDVDYVLFGGSDSLVNSSTAKERLAANRLRVTGADDADYLGEGAAFVVLERAKMAPEQVVVGGIAFDVLPAMGNPEVDANTTSGMIWSAMEDTGLELDIVGMISIPGSQEPPSSLAWSQAVRGLWPRMTPEERRQAVLEAGEGPVPLPADRAPETTRSRWSLGDVGAATFPLDLAMAYQRLKSESEPIEASLVVETGDHAVRGAVCLLQAGLFDAAEDELES